MNNPFPLCPPSADHPGYGSTTISEMGPIDLCLGHAVKFVSSMCPSGQHAWILGDRRTTERNGGQSLVTVKVDDWYDSAGRRHDVTEDRVYATTLVTTITSSRCSKCGAEREHSNEVGQSSLVRVNGRDV